MRPVKNETEPNKMRMLYGGRFGSPPLFPRNADLFTTLIHDGTSLRLPSPRSSHAAANRLVQSKRSNTRWPRNRICRGAQSTDFRILKRPGTNPPTGPPRPAKIQDQLGPKPLGPETWHCVCEDGIARPCVALADGNEHGRAWSKQGRAKSKQGRALSKRGRARSNRERPRPKRGRARSKRGRL